MSKPSPTIVATGLRKVLGTTVALRALDLEVAAGEIVALMGPNGAGKTTLLHLLAGLLTPDAGAVSIAGLGAPTRPAVRAHLGFAPQPTAVYDELSVEENLTFFARIQRLRGQQVRDAVERGVEIGRLQHKRGARASTLSGGMRRRLHVACAVVHRPKALLLDEPTVGVDEESCEHLLEAIGALRDEGTAVIWSTHDRTPIDRLGAREVRLVAGEIVA